jgi:xylulokinase
MEPAVYDKIDKVMLPGDFIAMKMTGDCTTTMSALSEGIFWNFKENKISDDIINYFGFDKSVFPTIHPLFCTTWLFAGFSRCATIINRWHTCFL